MLSTLLASAAGMGLVGHQAGFIVWDVQGVDLGFTKVAHAKTGAGQPAGVADTSEDFDDTAEMLRRTGGESGAIPAEDPFVVLKPRASLARKGVVPAAVPPAKVARLAGDTDHDVQEEIDAKDRAVNLCDTDSAAPGCSDTTDGEIDDALDDEVAELTLASLADDVDDDVDKDDSDKECEDDDDEKYAGNDLDDDNGGEGGEGGEGGGGEGGHD